MTEQNDVRLHATDRARERYGIEDFIPEPDA